MQSLKTQAFHQKNQENIWGIKYKIINLPESLTIKSSAYRYTLLLINKPEVMENLSKLTDDQLVALYLEGVNEAFDALLMRYKDRLYSYIYYSVHNADVTDDLFQETFVKAIMTLRQGRYVETGKFYSWLVRIAHNLIIDQFRLERNESTISNDEVERDLYGPGELTYNSAEREMEAEQSLKMVCQLIDYLPENQKEIVEMRIYKNMSFKEIAEQKGMSINTALGRMRYAIINMRRMADERSIIPYTF